jgi:hypothetical protein
MGSGGVWLWRDLPDVVPSHMVRSLTDGIPISIRMGREVGVTVACGTDMPFDADLAEGHLPREGEPLVRAL